MSLGCERKRSAVISNKQHPIHSSPHEIEVPVKNLLTWSVSTSRRNTPSMPDVTSQLVVSKFYRCSVCNSSVPGSLIQDSLTAKNMAFLTLTIASRCTGLVALRKCGQAKNATVDSCQKKGPCLCISMATIQKTWLIVNPVNPISVVKIQICGLYFFVLLKSHSVG